MKTIIALIAISIFTGCKSKQQESIPQKNNSDISFTILHQGAHGGRDTASEEIITNQEELKALYREFNNIIAPDIDFTQNNVVALFMGTKRSGGYSITVEKIAYNIGDKRKAYVLAKTKKPGKGQVVTLALTSPYCIVAIPKTPAIEVQYLMDASPSNSMSDD